MPKLKQKFQRLMLHLLRGLVKFAKFCKRIFRSKKAKTLALAILLVLIILPIYFFFSGRKTEASWWDEKWAFRKSIQLTNSGSVQTNVYVALTVDTSDTSKFQADCGDLRFTKNDGKILPHLIASGCGTNSTSVYVSFDSFPAGQQAIWQYYGNASAENGFAQTQTGAVTQANMKLSIINGTAFVDFSTANILTNNLNSKLVIADHTGLKLTGYIKAAGSGETYNNLLNNNIVTSDSQAGTGQTESNALSGWGHIANCTLSSSTANPTPYAGTYDLAVATTGIYAYSAIDFSTTSGMLSRLSYALVIVSGGNVNINAHDGNYGALYARYGFNSSSWQSLAVYRVALTTGAAGQISFSQQTTTASNFNIDAVSMAQVLTPSATGATITSTQGGSTYNWVSEDSGFIRNDASNYTYTIFPTNFSTEASSYSVGALGSEERSPAPIAYWSFDEGQGTTAHDESSNSNDGTITGATWKPESECVSGKCLQFDGSGDKVDVGDVNF